MPHPKLTIYDENGEFKGILENKLLWPDDDQLDKETPAPLDHDDQIDDHETLLEAALRHTEQQSLFSEDDACIEEVTEFVQGNNLWQVNDKIDEAAKKATKAQKLKVKSNPKVPEDKHQTLRSPLRQIQQNPVLSDIDIKHPDTECGPNKAKTKQLIAGDNANGYIELAEKENIMSTQMEEETPNRKRQIQSSNNKLVSKRQRMDTNETPSSSHSLTIKTTLGKNISKILGNTAIVCKFDELRVKWKAMPENKDIQERYLDSLAVMETKVSSACTKARSQLKNWEKEFYEKNSSWPSLDDRESDSDIREVYKLYSRGKELLRHWKVDGRK